MIIPGLYRRVPAPVEAPYPYMLAPADDRAAEVLAKLPGDKPVTIKVSRDRSSPQHRLFFAVLTYVAQATHWETPERLLVALKIRLGRYEPMALPSGKMVPVPDSISFAAMDQEQFAEFFDQAIEVICADVLPGMSSAELIEQAQAALGIAPERASADEPSRAEGEGAIVADPPPADQQNPSAMGGAAEDAADRKTAVTSQDVAISSSAAILSIDEGRIPGTSRIPNQRVYDRDFDTPAERQREHAAAVPTIEIVKPHGGKPDWLATCRGLIDAFCKLGTIPQCDAFRTANSGTVAALRTGNRSEYDMYQEVSAAHELALREKGQ